MLTKVLQGIIVAISGYIIYRIITINRSITTRGDSKKEKHKQLVIIS